MKTLNQHSALLDILHQHTRPQKSSLLVIRLTDVGRIALEKGRTHARALEEHCLAFLTTRASTLLRANDLLIHEPGTGDILILLGPSRDIERHTLPMDARMILERLVRVLQAEVKLRIERGWVTVGAILNHEELQQAIQSALQSGIHERERYAFFSTIGHELRTPLTAIRGYLETLREENLSAELRQRFVDIAYAESLRVNRLVDGMFDISMLDLHSDARKNDQCESHSALQAAVQAISATPKGQQTKITLEAQKHLHVAISYDRLVQIALNFLDNAIKFAHHPIEIHCHSRIENDRFLIISVEDNGPGVLEEDCERIFQLGERTAHHISGSGMGLAIVRLYAERAGGCTGCERSKLGGSAFWIRLPMINPNQ